MSAWLIRLIDSVAVNVTTVDDIGSLCELTIIVGASVVKSAFFVVEVGCKSEDGRFD